MIICFLVHHPVTVDMLQLLLTVRPISCITGSVTTAENISLWLILRSHYCIIPSTALVMTVTSLE